MPPKISEKEQRNMENIREVHDTLFAAGYHSGKILKGKGTEYMEFFVGPGDVPVIAVQHYNNNDGFEIWQPIALTNRMDTTLDALKTITRTPRRVPTVDEMEVRNRSVFEQS